MTEQSRPAALIAGLALWCFLAIPDLRAALEARLVSHMLLQIPLLVVAGYLVGLQLRCSATRIMTIWNRHGATGLAILLPAATFWMLPRWIDAALDSGVVELGKFLSLPWLVGLPLAMSVQQFGPMTMGVLKTNLISMALVLGWLYLVSPLRLCNSYLIDEQPLVGQLWILIGIALSIYWTAPLFFAQHAHHVANDEPRAL
jgi:hypothetical protein